MLFEWGDKMDLKSFMENQEKYSAKELIKISFDIFNPYIIASSSFGATSGILVHHIWELNLPIPIVYINTGFLFKETLQYIEIFKEKYSSLNFIEITPEIKKEEFFKNYGIDIIQRNPDLCCKINKVLPFEKYVKENGIKAWISGIRSEQTNIRKETRKISIRKKGLYKISPFLDWSMKKVYYYMKEHEIPFHPLFEKGYTSIGCEPCTDFPIEGDERSGRWKGKNKTECGLHTLI